MRLQRKMSLNDTLANHNKVSYGSVNYRDQSYDFIATVGGKSPFGLWYRYLPYVLSVLVTKSHLPGEPRLISYTAGVRTVS